MDFLNAREKNTAWKKNYSVKKKIKKYTGDPIFAFFWADFRSKLGSREVQGSSKMELPNWGKFTVNYCYNSYNAHPMVQHNTGLARERAKKNTKKYTNLR